MQPQPREERPMPMLCQGPLIQRLATHAHTCHAPPCALLLHRWHHIYLPMLPKTFMDYLTAPMPFMVGLPAQMLPMLKGIPMDEVGPLRVVCVGRMVVGWRWGKGHLGKGGTRRELNKGRLTSAFPGDPHTPWPAALTNRG